VEGDVATERYRHTQWGWTIIVASAGLATTGVFLALVGRGFIAAYVMVPVAVLMVALMGTLTVTVDDTHVRLRFGIGLIRKSVGLAAIRSAEITRFPWWVGSGIRLIDGGWLYSVDRRTAVDLRLDSGARVAIGTNDAAALLAAIANAAGIERTSAGVGDETSFPWPVAAMALLFAALGVLFYLQMQPAHVDITRERVSISSVFYRTEIPVRDITEVVVTDSAPVIEARTNGFAFGRTLRGRFRVRGIGEGALYVEMSSPPFVVIHTAGTYAMLSYRNYAYTSKLIEGLAKVSAP
jgi:hypothetical protein